MRELRRELEAAGVPLPHPALGLPRGGPPAVDLVPMRGPGRAPGGARRGDARQLPARADGRAPAGGPGAAGPHPQGGGRAELHQRRSPEPGGARRDGAFGARPAGHLFGARRVAGLLLQGLCPTTACRRRPLGGGNGCAPPRDAGNVDWQWLTGAQRGGAAGSGSGSRRERRRICPHPAWRPRPAARSSRGRSSSKAARPTTCSPPDRASHMTPPNPIDSPTRGTRPRSGIWGLYGTLMKGRAS